MNPLPLVLASSSPRRYSLLQRLGLEVNVLPAQVDETPHPDEPPLNVPLRLAREKAALVHARNPHLPVLAGDTVVILEGQILGKPQDVEEARRMLVALRGRTHLVATAVALRYRELVADHLEVAQVTFTPFPPSLLEWYLSGKEWQDKAGAYAVQGQGAVFVASVEGNVQAVVGLPLASLPFLFSRVGLELKACGSTLALLPRSESPRPAHAG
ncbi:MAG: Maf family protein [Thermoanaerobaculum sp.]|nr:Maf family protein [Thermoanaerobaculum sp.]MDW7968354.1 nucleoside triphosphate pyrophosphatase [Thermoanaerobaculum sp.]